MELKEKSLRKATRHFASKKNGELWFLQGKYHDLTYFLDDWNLFPAETVYKEKNGEDCFQFYNTDGEYFGEFYPNDYTGYIYVSKSISDTWHRNNPSDEIEVYQNFS